jgi:diguanylate cyclase (GGDEF)-like protein
MDLLGKITELQVKKARYANPLTLLPGNVVIQQTLAEAIEQAVGFAVAYLDLDNFKPYNDAYGYAHGDEILRLVARLLQEGVSPEADFVGHIGGDDFILLLYGGDWQERCQRILQIFRELVSLHYTEEDRERGGITAADRFGITRQFPIMSLSIGVLLLPQGCSGLTPERVAELASRAKSRAKRRQGNTICADTYECPRLGRGYSGRMPFREK